MSIYAIKREVEGQLITLSQSGRILAYTTEERARDKIDRMEGDRAALGLPPRGYSIVEFLEVE